MASCRMSQVLRAFLVATIWMTYQVLAPFPICGQDPTAGDGASAGPTDQRLDLIESQLGSIVEELQHVRTERHNGVVSLPPVGRELLTPENLNDVCLLAKIDRFAFELPWSPDGTRFAIVPWEGRIEIRTAKDLLPLSTLPFGSNTVHFAFGPLPNLVAFSENDGSKQVQIVNLASDQRTSLATGTGASRMDFSPDGSQIVTGGDGTEAYVWRVSDGELLHTLDMGPKRGGLTPVFSPDGQIVAVGNRNSTTRLFDVESGALRHELQGKVMSQGLAFRPQGDMLAIGYVDGSLALWDVKTGELTSEQHTNAEEIYRVAWSPSGDMLASAGLQADIIFWTAPELARLHSLPAPEWVIALSFSPDGKRLFTSGGSATDRLDREVRIWGIPVRSF